MKILIVNDNFNLSSGGGAERYVLDVVCGLKERGHTIFTSTSDEHLTECDTVYVNNHSDISLLERLQAKPAVRFIHDHRIYCPGTPKYWFCSNQNCGINTSLACAYYAFRERCLSRNPAKFIPRIIEAPKQIAVNKNFTRLVVASHFMKSMLVKNGFDSQKIIVNPLFPYYASDPPSSRWPPGLRGASKSNKEEVPVILYVGRIFVEKGVDYLVRACAMLKGDYRLVVIGTGWDLERCRSLAVELGIGHKVDFLGFLPPEKIAHYYRICCLVVVPSIWPEPFCMIGPEAMSHRKPVVAFDSGGISEWLKNGENGFLVERLDVKKLSEKIDSLLANPKLAEKLGEKGYNMVREEFTLGKHLDKLEEIFEPLSKK